MRLLRALLDPPGSPTLRPQRPRWRAAGLLVGSLLVFLGLLLVLCRASGVQLGDPWLARLVVENRRPEPLHLTYRLLGTSPEETQQTVSPTATWVRQVWAFGSGFEITGRAEDGTVLLHERLSWETAPKEYPSGCIRITVEPQGARAPQASGC